MTYAQAAAHCGSLGGRLPALNEFIALANGGPNIGTTWLEWASDVTADNEAVYINDSSPTGSQDMDGVRPMVTSSWTRCVRPPAQALGTP
jgi:hypothetical protein